MLNTDQQKALTFLRAWWTSPEMFAVLTGPGGVGKTYLLESFIQEVSRKDTVSPLFLAPTHEALLQLRQRIPGDYPFKTIHSSLGIVPTGEKEVSFSKLSGKLPDIWEQVNLCIVDEASMIPEDILNLLMSTKVKTLFVGHESQLPPVVPSRHRDDPCISPVFMTGKDTGLTIPKVLLSIPMRNSGELWAYTQQVESSLANPAQTDIKSVFDCTKGVFNRYIRSTEGQDSIRAGDTKVILWSNKGVAAYNDIIRQELFGEKALLSRFLPGDKILLTEPLFQPSLSDYTESRLSRLNKAQTNYYFSNAQATILGFYPKTLAFNKAFSLDVTVAKVAFVDSEATIVIPNNPMQMAALATYLEHVAWNAPTPSDKKRAYERRRFILSCFASVLHAYAVTTHRVQGKSIDTVFVMLADIRRNPNPIETKKCWYTAVSRAKRQLFVYKGVA
jgi:GTPase SAR1 family protein